MSNEISDYERAMEVRRAVLEGESWFEDTVRARMLAAEAAKPGGHLVKPGSSYPTLANRTWHTHLNNLVQFLFFLKALQCTDPVSIERFVDAHNEKVEQDLEDGSYHVSKGELKRAEFTDRRKKQLVLTFAHYGKPVFTAFELGCLLIDLMSPKTTENILADLRMAGLIKIRGGEDDPFDAPLGTDSRRELLEPDSFLVDSYCQSLLQTRTRL